MNKDLLLSIEKGKREVLMRKELGEGKCKILDKYNLHINDRLYWERIQEKYPTQEYFSHKFAIKSSELGMVFQIYRLCFAKTKYFENNWNKFIPCYHDLKNGFVETEICNMNFLKHKSTGIIIDLRELAKIKWIKEFHDICDYLESSEKIIELKKQNIV